LVAVVQEAYVNSVSTRKVDRLAEQMGLHHVGKDQVSRLCRGLDEQVRIFRERQSEQPLLENLDELRVFLRDMVQHSQEMLTARFAVLLADVAISTLTAEVTIETSGVAAEAAELDGGAVAAKIAQETIERTAARIMEIIEKRIERGPLLDPRLRKIPPWPPPLALPPAPPVLSPPSLPQGGPGTPQPPVGMFGPAGPMSLQDWFRELGMTAKGLAEALRVVGDALIEFLDLVLTCTPSRSSACPRPTSTTPSPPPGRHRDRPPPHRQGRLERPRLAPLRKRRGHGRHAAQARPVAAHHRHG
jgi:Transposase, Mutator family